MRKAWFRRFVARVLVLSILVSSLVSSLCPGVVYAGDSNDKRRAMIRLVRGDALSDINASTNLDEGTLRTLSVFLSNFYVPFATVLNGDFQGEDQKDSGNDDYLQKMEDALEKNLGLNKQSAEFLVNYLLSQSLSTCSPMYIKKETLKQMWEFIQNTETGAGDTFSSYYYRSIGFYGMGNSNLGNVNPGISPGSSDMGDITYSGLEDNVFTYKVSDFNSAARRKGFSDAGFNAYCKYVDSYTYKKEDYVGVTYPVFLQLMGMCYAISAKDAEASSSAEHRYSVVAKGEYSLSFESMLGILEKDEVTPPSDATYDISNRTNAFSGLDVESETSGNHAGGSFSMHLSTDNSENSVDSSDDEAVTLTKHIDGLPSPSDLASGRFALMAEDVSKKGVEVTTVTGEALEKFMEGMDKFSHGIDPTTGKPMHNNPTAPNNSQQVKPPESNPNKESGIVVAGPAITMPSTEEIEELEEKIDEGYADVEPITNISMAKINTKKVPRINFYCKDSTGEMHTVFSTSEECMQAYANVCDKLNYNAGWGSGFSALGDEKIEAVDNAGHDTISALAVGWKLHVNWEGSIIADTGAYRTPIFPGCANPHMLTTVEDSADNANTIPLQNVYSVRRALDGHIVSKPYKVIGKNKTYVINKAAPELEFYVGNYSLFNLNKWRTNIGLTTHQFDSNKKPFNSTWGSKERVYDVMSKCKFIYENPSTFDSDYLNFPSWFHMLWSDIYFMNVPSTNAYLTSVLKIKKNHNVYIGENTPTGSDDDDIYTILGCRPAYGSPVLNDKIVTFDDLGNFNDSSSLGDIFSADLSIVDVATKTETRDALGISESSLNVYSQFTNFNELGQTISYDGCQQFFRSLFFSYCFAYFNKDALKYDKDTCVIDLKMNPDNFPSYNQNVDWASLYASNVEDQVLSFIYYLLHPLEGISYVATLLKNKIGGFLLRIHDDMVGSTDSNSATGMTKYLGTSSYTTTSNLYDVPWIATILENYNYAIVYLIILMCLILLCYVLVGSLSIQRGIIGLTMFAFLAFLPPVAINFTVNTVNKFSDTVYSEKFEYWAIVQMETWLQGYDEALDAQRNSDFSSYAAFLLKNQAQMSSGIAGDVATSYSGTKVKWMTPKRFNSLALVATKVDSIQTDAVYLKNLLMRSVVQAASGESYLDSDSALYLYRDYTDIYRYGAVSYNVVHTFNFNGTLLNTNPCSTKVYYNVVPFKNKNINTIKRVWEGNVSDGIKKIVEGDSKLKTDGLPVAKYILANADYSTSDADIYSEVSSLRAIERGFLLNTVGANSVDLVRKTYYHNVKDGGYNNTLALTYLALYNENVLRVHNNLNNFKAICREDSEVELNLGNDVLKADSKVLSDKYTHDVTVPMFNYGGWMHSESDDSDFKLGYNHLVDARKNLVLNATGGQEGGNTYRNNLFRQLSSLYYGLYSESPYYFFNNNIRDQMNALMYYKYDYDNLADSKGSTTLSPDTGSKLAKMLVRKDQDYFYNLEESSGDGYGELRDFMNMHDLFYYIIPMLRDGVTLARLYDNVFGLYTDDDCSLSFNIDGTNGYASTFTYNNVKYPSLTKFNNQWNKMNKERRYKFWHSYNTFSILLNYTAWLDTMMDCDYAKKQEITVMGTRYTVADPLDPTTYYQVDDDGNITAGRLMVFSRSEMEYYGLHMSDLTTVEQKIITLQDNVYNEALDLMNYYSLSNETLIHAYAMLQTFEFNKIFSQKSVISEDYILYPQGYELKAFSYDAYLRMIISEASGESLMSETEVKNEADPTAESTMENTSIYRRVLNNTSLFFAIFLLINDIMAVYLIPGLKLFFILCLFFTSILLLIGASVKLEMNILKVLWKSLIAPLLAFSGVSMGMSLLVSMFLGTGADNVTNKHLVINLGDPTATIIVMIIINAGVTILYFKICKKCFHDFKTYFKAVFDNIGSTAVGVVGAAANMLRNNRFTRGMRGRFGRSKRNYRVASTAKQRGKDNSPASGKTGVGVGAAAAGAVAGAAGASVAGSDGKDTSKHQEAVDKEAEKMKNYNAKAFKKAHSKADSLLDDAARYDELAGSSAGIKKKMLERASAKKFERAEKQEQYAKDIKSYGKVGAMKRRINRGVGEKAGKVTSRMTNMRNRITVGADKVRTVYKEQGGAKGIAKAGGRVIKRNAVKAGRVAKGGVQKAGRAVASGTQKVVVQPIINTGKDVAGGYRSARENVVNRDLKASGERIRERKRAQKKLGRVPKSGKRIKPRSR